MPHSPGMKNTGRSLAVGILFSAVLFGFLETERGGPEAAPSPIAGQEAAERRAQLPTVFIENRGQWEPETRFIARRGGATLRVEKDALALAVAGGSVRIAFEGTREEAEAAGLDRQAGYYNFYIGNDPSRWREHVPGYAQARLTGLYPGVDLAAREDGGNFEYDLLLAPGADLDRVTAVCQGVDSIGISTEGKLVMESAFGTVTQGIPATWEVLPDGTRRPVACSYRLLGGTRFGFSIPRRDPALACVIDPPLEFSTYLGGRGDDRAFGIALMPSGSVVVGGFTYSADFPRTPGAFDTTGDAERGDGFVSVIAPDGRHLLYSTYIGGDDYDSVEAVDVDARGLIALAGSTSSIDFPRAGYALPIPKDGTDAFVCRLDATGVLAYSTLAGGVYGRAVAFAPDGDLVVAGAGVDYRESNLADFSYRSPAVGEWDVFVMKLSESRRTPVFTAVFGGRANDECWDLDVEPQTGVILMVGTTDSADLDVRNAFDDSFNGGERDAFVAGLRPDGTDLVFASYLGGAGKDGAYGLAVGGVGEFAVCGETDSRQEPGRFPLVDPVQQSWGGTEGFLALFRDYRTMAFSTFIGGSNDDLAWDVALDGDGPGERLLTVVGGTHSTEAMMFPVTPDAYDRTHNGYRDLFVAQVSVGAGPPRVIYGTYLGAGSSESPWGGIVTDGIGRCVVAGETYSYRYPGFPVTSGAVDRSFGGISEAFVSSLNIPTRYECGLVPLFDVQDVRREQTVSFDVVVRNNTTNSTSDVVVDLFGFRHAGGAIERPYGGGDAFATVTVRGLVPGETRAVRRSYTIPPNTPLGIYTIRARLPLGGSHDAFAFSFRVRE